MEPKQRACVKRWLQFLGFLIFRMIEERADHIGRFAVVEKQRFGRTVIWLYSNEKPILALLEDCLGEWLARIDGSQGDIAEFIMEYTVYSLTKNDQYISGKGGK